MSPSVLLRPPAAVRERSPVFCVGTQCGELLGHAGTSALEGNRKPVWHIEPGWLFVRGILQRSDQELREERRFLKETLDQERRIVGVHHAREVDLPVNVRCPTCHRVQLVVAHQLRRREPPGGRR